MVSLYQLLYETGPSAQGLGSYDKRFKIPNALDRAEDAGLFDLYDKLDGEMEERPEDNETVERVSVKTTP